MLVRRSKERTRETKTAQGRKGERRMERDAQSRDHFRPRPGGHLGKKEEEAYDGILT